MQDLDLTTRSTFYGSNTMWHITLSLFAPCAKCARQGTCLWASRPRILELGLIGFNFKS